MSLTSTVSSADLVTAAGDLYRTTQQDNVTGDVTTCGNHSTPTALTFIINLTGRQIFLLSLYLVSTVITLVIYTDEIFFVSRHFKCDLVRSQKTIWVLAVFPVFAFTGLLGYTIPHAAPIIDLVANTFMATCLFNMMELMIIYMGGPGNVWKVMRENQVKVEFATLPICCLLPCLPTTRIDRVLLRRLNILVLQVCIFRPILMFIAAIMWADGTYTHSGLNPKTGDPYITIINATTTIIAVYGLNLCKTAFVKPLKGYMLGGKIFIVQMVLATCSLSPGIIKLFWKWGLVQCDPVYQPHVHLDFIYRGVLVISMLVYSVTGRFMYRRLADALPVTTPYVPCPEDDIEYKTRLLNFMKNPTGICASAISRLQARSAQAHETESLKSDVSSILPNGSAEYGTNPVKSLSPARTKSARTPRRNSSKNNGFLIPEDVKRNCSEESRANLSFVDHTITDSSLSESLIYVESDSEDEL